MRTYHTSFKRFHLRIGGGWLFSLGWHYLGIEAYRAKAYLWPQWTRVRGYGVTLFGLRWRVNLGELSDPLCVPRNDPRLRARFYRATEADLWPDVLTEKPSPASVIHSRL
jgi:hypothetical protein